VTDTQRIIAGISDGQRRALGRLITLIESTRLDHREDALSVINQLPTPPRPTIRIGISGVPGVGKSSFIEAFGLHVIEQGHRVAVLAVDPSSPKTGGSILGDKTRMEQLARNNDAFIRPTPSAGSLGGVARRTRETILAVEAADFDVVLVETVGVGQSEYAVADLVDMFVLLVAPGGGDDLQGIKKGIVEMADLIVVTKCDGDLIPAANRAFQDYRSALHMLNPGTSGWAPKVLRTSAHSAEGLEDVWTAITDFQTIMNDSGALQAKRADQATSWMWDEVTSTLLKRIKTASDSVNFLETAVRKGEMTPSEAAKIILSDFET
jgi:LAO/AO transport system kinase